MASYAHPRAPRSCEKKPRLGRAPRRASNGFHRNPAARSFSSRGRRLCECLHRRRPHAPASGDQCIRARRGLAEMRAGSSVTRGLSHHARSPAACSANTRRASPAVMPALSDDTSPCQHTAEARVRLRRIQAQLGQAQRARHVRAIGSSEGRHQCFFFCIDFAASPSSGNCRPSSSGRSRSSLSISSRNACTSSKRRYTDAKRT